MVKKNNKKLIIGISVMGLILILFGVFLFTPSSIKLQPASSQSSTSYFERDGGGNFVPSTTATVEQIQEPNILTQPAQEIQPTIKPSTAQITPSVQPKGHLTNVKISGTTFTLGNPIKVTGTFVAETPGDYYIEAGLVEGSRQPLALFSSQSACDQSRNYAGVWYKGAKSRDAVDFELSFVDYGITGKYNVEGGVYSRCGIGADIASISPIKVLITSSQPTISSPSPTNTNTNPPSSTTPSVCTPSGYFTQLWVRKTGTIGRPVYPNTIDYTSIDNSKPKVVGVFKNNAPCKVTYYIEAGMLESSYRAPLALMPFISGLKGTPSACDQNVYFSGVMATLNSGESTGFALYPQNYGKAGTFAITGGVFNQNGKFCGFGANIASFPSQDITFKQYASSIETDNSWERII